MGVETEEKEEIVLDGKDMRIGFLVLGFLAYEYLIFFFLNIVLTWKIVEASKASVLYIYIDNKTHFTSLIVFNKNLLNHQKNLKN